MNYELSFAAAWVSTSGVTATSVPAESSTGVMLLQYKTLPPYCHFTPYQRHG